MGHENTILKIAHKVNELTISAEINYPWNTYDKKCEHFDDSCQYFRLYDWLIRMWLKRDLICSALWLSLSILVHRNIISN